MKIILESTLLSVKYKCMWNINVNLNLPILVISKDTLPSIVCPESIIKCQTDRTNRKFTAFERIFKVFRFSCKQDVDH